MLPLTLPMTANDLKFTQRMYPGLPDPEPPKGCADPCLKVYYDEKLEVGYRRYDSHNIEPAYAFGHGLSYTSFAYGNLTVSLSRVTFDVRNVGGVAGAGSAALRRPPTAELSAAQGLPQDGRAGPGRVECDAPLRRQNSSRSTRGGLRSVHELRVGASSRDARLRGTVYARVRADALRRERPHRHAPQADDPRYRRARSGPCRYRRYNPRGASPWAWIPRADRPCRRHRLAEHFVASPRLRGEVGRCAARAGRSRCRLVNTLNAEHPPESVSFILRAIIVRNSGKSIAVAVGVDLIMSASRSVGSGRASDHRAESRRDRAIAVPAEQGEGLLELGDLFLGELVSLRRSGVEQRRHARARGREPSRGSLCRVGPARRGARRQRWARPRRPRARIWRRFWRVSAARAQHGCPAAARRRRRGRAGGLTHHFCW